MFGKHHDIEAINKISQAKIGKYDGENNPIYGKIGVDNPRFGKTHSDEVKEKYARNLSEKQPASSDID